MQSSGIPCHQQPVRKWLFQDRSGYQDNQGLESWLQESQCQFSQQEQNSKSNVACTVDGIQVNAVQQFDGEFITCCEHEMVKSANGNEELFKITFNILAH